MKKRLISVSLAAVLIIMAGIALCGCTKTVENEEMTLSLNNIGERTGTYTGEVNSDGIPEGQGKFDTENTEGIEWYYEGAWVNGQMEGEGATVWVDGTKHEGSYIDSIYDGQGKFYEDDSIVFEGEYKAGEYASGKLFNAKEEVVYEGEFKNGIPADKKQIKDSAVKVTYKKLAKNENTYMGDIVSVTGEVIQVLEGDDGYAEYRLALDEWWNDVVYLTYTRDKNEDRILEGDNITVYGMSRGLYTYESTEGVDITVPWIDCCCYK